MKQIMLIVIGVVMAACATQKPEIRTVRGVVLDAYAESAMIQENDTTEVWIVLTEVTDMSECDGLVAGQSVAAECKVTQSTTGEVLTAIKVIAPDMPYEHYLTGSWVEPNPVAPDQVLGFTLESDGSAHSINTDEVVYRSWSLRGNRLVLVAESANEDEAFEQQIVYVIRGVSGRKLTLESESGEIRIYSRQ